MAHHKKEEHEEKHKKKSAHKMDMMHEGHKAKKPAPKKHHSRGK